MKAFILLFLIVTIFSSVYAKEGALITKEDRKLIDYYASPNYLINKRIDVMKEKSKKFFKTILKIKNIKDQKRVAAVMKGNPWKLINKSDEKRMKERLYLKITNSNEGDLREKK